MRYSTASRDALTTIIMLTLIIPATLPPLAITPAAGANPEGNMFRLLSVSWGTSTAPACVGPASSAQLLTVTLAYVGNETLPGVNAVLDLPWGFTDTLTKTSTATARYSQPLPKGGVFTLTFRVDVSGYACAGEYSALLTLYDSTSGEELDRLTVMLTVANKADIVLASEHATLHPGLNNLSVVLKNVGEGSAYGVTVNLAAQQQVVFFGQGVELGDLPPGSSANLTTRLYIPSALTNSVVPITLSVSYVDECGLSEARTLTLNTLVTERPDLPRLVITASDTTLTAGLPNTLTVSVLNNGSEAVRGLKVSFTIPQQLILVNTSSQWLIDSLGAGAVASTRLTLTPISVSSDRTLIQIPVTLSYVDQYGVSRSEATSILVAVAQPQTSVSVDVKPQELSAGKVNEITLRVSNAGAVPLYALTLTLTLPQPLVLRDSAGRWVLGDLGVGGAREVRLRVAVPLSASGDLQAGVVLSYVDPSGAARTESKNVVLTVVRPDGPLAVSVEPRELRYGSNFLNVTVMNEGAEVLRDVSVSVTQAQIIFKNLYGSWHAGDLTPGESRTLTMEVFIPSTVGSNLQITVSTTYKDVAGVTQSESRVYGLSVRPGLTLVKVTANPDSLKAGENSLKITVSNEGDNPIYNLLATLTPQGAAFRQFDGVWTVGDLMPGDSRSVDVTLAVPQAATAVQITASLNYVDAGGVARAESKVVTLTATPSNAPNIKVMVEPTTVVGGRETRVNLTVANVAGQRLENMLVTVSAGGLTFVGFDGKWYVDVLEPGESKTLGLTAYAAPVEARQNLGLSVTASFYSPSSGTSLSESYTIPIAVLPDSLRGLEITVSPTTLTAGRVNNVTVSVSNPNRYGVTSVVLSASPPSGTVLMGPDTYYVDLIDPGSTASVVLPLYLPSTTSTTMSLGVSVSYFDGTSTRTTAKSLSFLIALPPAIKMTSYTVLPQTVTPGQTFSVSVSISNTGLGTAYNVTARVSSNPFLTPLLGSEMFLGDISKGASTTMTFSFRASSELAALLNATTTAGPASITRTRTATSIPTAVTWVPRTTANTTGGHPAYGSAPPLAVVITLSYADNVGRPYGLTLTIPINVGSSGSSVTQPPPTNTGYWSPAVAVLVAVPVAAVALIYVLRRLRRK